MGVKRERECGEDAVTIKRQCLEQDLNLRDLLSSMEQPGTVNRFLQMDQFVVMVEPLPGSTRIAVHSLDDSENSESSVSDEQ
mmetsp:Transcript_89517/g.134208  ORF Transcript_89517/g.134208 Transcript_89517/m.134208 type:complete len:82 (+) Transcript_89517:68-313(+)